jgi:hypothetical protein
LFRLLHKFYFDYFYGISKHKALGIVKMPTTELLPLSTETGKLKVMHLKRYWAKSLLKREGKLGPGSVKEEWTMDTTLLTVLGLGLEQTVKFVYGETPSFEEFENWILTVTGAPDAGTVNKFNKLFTGDGAVIEAGQSNHDALTNYDLDFWEENGYVIVRNAVSREDCDRAIEIICGHLGIDRYDATTWYDNHPSKQGIMVQLFQHPLLNQNRRSPKIERAFEQLWQRTDIWVNTDRVGFNPPETLKNQFQGPRLHWDVSIKTPIPFGTQGILYLADTAENQGAFTVVPGFHNKVADWLNSLPEGANPRMQDLYALGPKPVAANAGDCIIWHHGLPHGSSPNTATLPRFVQYLNYAPADKNDEREWI